MARAGRSAPRSQDGNEAQATAFNKHRTGELIIKRRYSSRVKLFVIGLAVVLLIVARGAIYKYGMTAAGFEKFTAFRQQS